jgi:starvation-inducible outer membrane lipoprotein
MTMRYLSILLIAGLSGCSATPHNVDDDSAAKQSAERQNRDFEATGVPQQLPRDTLRDF